VRGNMGKKGRHNVKKPKGYKKKIPEVDDIKSREPLISSKGR